MANEPTSIFPLSEQRMRNNLNRDLSPSLSSHIRNTKDFADLSLESAIHPDSVETGSSITTSGATSASAVQTLNPNSMAMVTNGGPRPSKNERLCRNVLIYGACRFEDKGCVYSHVSTQGVPPKTSSVASSGTISPSGSIRHRGPLASSAFGSTSTPAFQPSPTRPNAAAVAASTSSAFSNSSPMTSPSRMTASISAPVFKPSGSALSTMPTNTNGIGSSISTEHLKAATFVPRSGPTNLSTSTTQNSIYQPTEEDVESPSTGRGEMAGFVPGSTVNMNGAAPGGTSSQGMTMEQKEFFPTDTRVLDHHLYTTPLPHTSNLPASHLPLHNFFLPADLLTFVHNRAEAKLITRATDGTLPSELHVYHSLHTLMAEITPQERSMRVFGYITDSYRARCRLDGRLYCLRRVEGFKLVKDTAFSVLDKWRRIRHPNIVSVREAFTTRLFNDSSVIFAYDYHPNSRTIYEAHLGNQMEMVTQPNGTIAPAPKAPTGIPERVLWSYVAQIANGLKAIHTAGLACRTIEPTKIILTGRNRIRLNCCSIFDVITYESPSSNLHYQQQDDLLNFGKLLVSLCCGTTGAVHSLSGSLEAIHNAYSPDVKLVILYLLGKPGPGKSIDDILVMLGPRLLNEFDAMQNYADSLESGLEAEVENGRVARMLVKLGFINERPEFQQDPRWSETGDRYVLKLFRDYVFHSVDEIGNPVLDLTHVLLALNKTDAGLDEKIMLVARDEQSCIVVSYREIKNSIDKAYMELLQQSMGIMQ